MTTTLPLTQMTQAELIERVKEVQETLSRTKEAGLLREKKQAVAQAAAIAEVKAKLGEAQKKPRELRKQLSVANELVAKTKLIMKHRDAIDEELQGLREQVRTGQVGYANDAVVADLERTKTEVRKLTQLLGRAEDRVDDLITALNR